MVMFRAAGTGATTEGGATTAPALTGTTWQWTESMTANTATAVADPTRYAITFNEDGTANITADCNAVTGTYTTDANGALTITLGASTAVGCPEDSQDTEFLAALATAASYSFDGETLMIGQAGDAGTLLFQAAAATGETEAGGAGEASEMSLTGTVWQWVETITPMETITAADPTRYTITFNEDGTAAIGADCNQVTATYTVADSALTIVPGASTLALCPEDSQATAFLAGLSSAAIYFFQDGHLFIDQFASAGTLKLAPAAAAEEPDKGETTAPATGGLVGPVWQLTGITKVDGNITINDPTRYTISFNADGTANLVTDCNVGGATYSTGEGNTLTITPGVSTMAFCGPGSFDQIFLGGLTNAMGYRIEEGNLLIDMLYESGTLMFVPAP
jgi:heat shock protein HslJ